MRADHSWPQPWHSYHAITQVLSAVGPAACPQSGHFIEAVAESNVDTPIIEQPPCHDDVASRGRNWNSSDTEWR